MFATRYCPECGRPLAVHDVRGSELGCPACRATLPGEASDRWTNVARVTSLAEAGFLADELAGEGIDARIYQADEFSALSDRWNAHYLIQTAPGDAQAAAARIRRHLAEMDAGRSSTGGQLWDDQRATVDPIFWRPVVLMVLAGVVSFVVGQRFAAERDAARQPPQGTLSGAVNAIGRPLVTEPAAGLPRHRLYYSGRQQSWYLDTDANGDGRYESRQRFHATGAGW